MRRYTLQIKAERLNEAIIEAESRECKILSAGRSDSGVIVLTVMANHSHILEWFYPEPDEKMPKNVLMCYHTCNESCHI